MVVYGPPFEAYTKYFPLHLATRNQKNLQVPDSAELSSAKKPMISSVFAKSCPAHLRQTLGGLIVPTSDKPFHITLSHHFPLARPQTIQLAPQNNPISPAEKRLRLGDAAVIVRKRG